MGEMLYKDCVKKLVLILSIVFLAFPVWAKKGQVAQLQKNLIALKGLSAQFDQTVYSSRFGNEKGQGQIILVKPNKMRWVYDNPKGRVFLADGETFYRFDPEDQTTHKMKQSEIQQDPTMGLFLDENIDLQKHFDVTFKKEKKKKTIYTLTLKKEDSDIKAIDLTVSFNPFVLHAFETTSQINQKNKMIFTDFKSNPQVNADLFSSDLWEKTTQQNTNPPA